MVLLHTALRMRRCTGQKRQTAVMPLCWCITVLRYHSEHIPAHKKNVFQDLETNFYSLFNSVQVLHVSAYDSLARASYQNVVLRETHWQRRAAQI